MEAGKNDMLGEVTRDICPEYELHGALENMVTFSQEADTEFWTFLRQTD